MKAEIIAMPAHQRFSNLCEGDALDQFEWFEITPCRNDESEGCVVQCEAGEVEFWSIYGRKNEGTKDAPEYLAIAVHDEWNVEDIVRVARQIAIETGKGFLAGDVAFGQFPRTHHHPVPAVEFTELAEDLTFAIHEDLDDRNPHNSKRSDDFDSHPLVSLREAMVDYSNYSGADQLDPYQPKVITH